MECGKAQQSQLLQCSFFSRHNIEIARLKCLRGLLESASISQRSQWFHSFQGWICHGEREVNRRASVVQVSGRNGWISSANREKLAKIRNETWARLSRAVCTWHFAPCWSQHAQTHNNDPELSQLETSQLQKSRFSRHHNLIVISSRSISMSHDGKRETMALLHADFDGCCSDASKSWQHSLLQAIYTT